MAGEATGHRPHTQTSYPATGQTPDPLGPYPSKHTHPHPDGTSVCPPASHPSDCHVVLHAPSKGPVPISRITSRAGTPSCCLPVSLVKLGQSGLCNAMCHYHHPLLSMPGEGKEPKPRLLLESARDCPVPSRRETPTSTARCRRRIPQWVRGCVSK